MRRVRRQQLIVGVVGAALVLAGARRAMRPAAVPPLPALTAVAATTRAPAGEGRRAIDPSVFDVSLWRSPEPPASTVRTAAARPSPPPPPPAPALHVLGVIDSPGARRVALYRVRSDEVITAAVGEAIDDWRVSRIGPDAIVLTHAHGDAVLRLREASP